MPRRDLGRRVPEQTPHQDEAGVQAPGSRGSARGSRSSQAEVTAGPRGRDGDLERSAPGRADLERRQGAQAGLRWQPLRASREPS